MYEITIRIWKTKIIDLKSNDEFYNIFGYLLIMVVFSLYVCM